MPSLRHPGFPELPAQQDANPDGDHYPLGQIMRSWGVGATALEVLLLQQHGAASLQSSLALGLVVAKIDNAIISLLIIGLGASHHILGMARAKFGVAAACCTLLFPSLPVAVLFISCLLVVKWSPRRPSSDGIEPEVGCYGCARRCSLRRVLQVLLVLAIQDYVLSHAEFVTHEPHRSLQRALSRR